MLKELRQIRLPLVGAVVLAVLAVIAFLVIEAARGSVGASELPVIQIGQVAPGLTDTSAVPGPTSLTTLSPTAPGSQSPGPETTGSGSTDGTSTGSTPTATTAPGAGGQTTTTGGGSRPSEQPGISSSTVRETVQGSLRSSSTNTTQGR